jgi:hypothetical protein
MIRSTKTLLLAATFALCSGASLITANAAGMSPEAAIAAAKMAEAAEAQGMLGYMQATSQTSDNLHI